RVAEPQRKSFHHGFHGYSRIKELPSVPSVKSVVNSVFIVQRPGRPETGPAPRARAGLSRRGAWRTAATTATTGAWRGTNGFTAQTPRSAAFQRTNRPQPLPPQYHRNCIMQVYFLPWMDTNDANVKHGSGALNARRSGQ